MIEAAAPCAWHQILLPRRLHDEDTVTCTITHSTLLAVLLLAACAEKKAPPPPPVPVTVAVAERRTIPFELPATGTVEPIQTVAVQAQVSGPLQRVAFKEGDEVK